MIHLGPLARGAGSNHRTVMVWMDIIRPSAWRFLLLSAAVACNDRPPLQQAHTVRDSSGVRIVENLRASWPVPWQVDAEPLVSIGSVSGNPDQELDQVMGAVRLPDDGIVVANGGRLELLFYDRGGKFLRRVGRPGGGPGEFKSVEWLARHRSDSVMVLDVWNQRVSYFDGKGNLGRSVRFEPNAQIPFPRPMAVFADGSFLAGKGLFNLGGKPPVRTERTSEPLFHIAADGATAVLLDSFPGPEMVIAPTGPRGQMERRGRPFGHATAFAAAGDQFYVADNETYEVRVYSISGQLKQVIRKQTTPLAITDADVRAYEDSVLATGDAMQRRQMRAMFENLPPAPTAYPAYAPDILIDTEGNLWIRESSRPGAQHSQWSVFAPSGELLGSLDMPPRLDVLEVGTDYVLGLARDDMDVEYILKYRLRKGR